MSKIETLEEMKNRLGSSGSTKQIKVAIMAVERFYTAGGVLDSQNAAVVLHHLAIACQSARYSFQFSAFGNSQRAA